MNTVRIIIHLLNDVGIIGLLTFECFRSRKKDSFNLVSERESLFGISLFENNE